MESNERHCGRSDLGRACRSPSELGELDLLLQWDWL